MEDNNDGEINNSHDDNDNAHDTDYDELAKKWLNLCMLGVASASAAVSAWLQLSFAAIALHSSQMHSTPTARRNKRRAVIENITQSDRQSKDLSRLSTTAFEALVSDLKTKSKENSKLEKLCDKACHNWDKLFELYGGTRATGCGASGLKEKAKTLQRGLDFDDLRIGTEDMNWVDTAAYEASSYGEHDFSRTDGALASTPEYLSMHQSGRSSSSKLKRKSSMISVMEDGYKVIAASIDKLSMAIVGTGEKVAGSKFDVSQNRQIYDALLPLGLDENYRFGCYCYLCTNPSKAAIIVAAPTGIRSKLLADIMQAGRPAQ